MKETNTWIRIADCSDIPPREGRAVTVGNREIAIFNLGSRFLAIDNRCPHKGGPLADGIVSGATVVCPLHAWKMNLETGKGVSAPSESSCVRTFPTRVEDGVILLEVNETSRESETGATLQQPVLCTQPRGIGAITNLPSAAEA
jgi:nitrite reductase (NADH) small subunit